MGNPITQFQIVSKTPEETASFYAALFAWNVGAGNAMGYRRIDTGSPDGIQGGIWPGPPQAPVFTQLFVSVTDVKATVERAVALGANVIIPPTMLPDGEEMAILHDPQGMGFGLVRAGEGR